MSGPSVLHVITTLDRGGAELALLHLCRAQREAGARVEVAYLKGVGELTPAFEGAGVPVHPLTLEGLAGMGALSRTQSMIGVLRPDVVHSHLFKADCLAAGALSRRNGHAAALVSTKHNEDAYLAGRSPLVATVRAVARRAAERADALVAISDGVARFVARHLPRVAEKTRVIRYGVPPPSAPTDGDVAALRDRLGLLGSETLLVCPARFAKQKDHATLIAAFGRLPRSGAHAGVRLILLGRGRLEAALRRDVAAAGLDGRVIFGGFLPNLGPAYRLARAVVLSSVHEGLGLALVEAAQHALPAVATRVGGIPEVVRDGVTGRLVPPSDPAALAAALTDVVDDGETARRRGAAAQDHVAHLFDLRERTADMLALYDHVLGARR